MVAQLDSPEPSGEHIRRRTAVGLIGTAGAAAVAAPLLTAAPAAAAPSGAAAFHPSPDTTGAPPVQGLHLTFGRDPATQMVVSWLTDAPVRRPRVLYGTLGHGLGSGAAATTRSYSDGKSGRTVYVHHAELSRLSPGTDYLYVVSHDGATPDSGTFTTAPRGRQPLTFTSFGDQSAPQVTWAADGTVALDANSTPATKDIVTGVEQVAPLFHLLNGDLCYANLDLDRVRTWNNFFTNNTRSARFRPWMPAAGNHEIESGNGPIGLGAYQTYFALPSTETDDELAGLWYAFTAGSVRVIVLQNDDNCLQDGGDVYISGYSGGRQLAFLERELKAARADREVDWIVVAMHQVMISSSDANGADLGLRAKYGPLFDRYGVDLVVCGHEHNYERSLAVRGVVGGSETLTPNPASPPYRRHRHRTRHRAHGAGRRRGVGHHQPVVLQGRHRQGHHRGVGHGRLQRQAHRHVRQGAGGVDRRARRRTPLRLRGVHRRPGPLPRGHHAAARHVLQREQAAR